MTTRKQGQTSKRTKTTRLSRAELANLLSDLCDRLDAQVWIVDAIVKAVAPTDETKMGAWPMRKVIELAANAHLSDLRLATQFARAINAKVAS